MDKTIDQDTGIEELDDFVSPVTWDGVVAAIKRFLNPPFWIS
jgi:hypothetical protein